jgi:hypothetical protein
MNAARLALSVLAVSLAWARAGEPVCEVNVNTSITEAGKKVVPPTREKPAYYFPVVAGWREEGSLVAGEKPPPRLMVIHTLAKTLAGQNFLVVGPKTPPPTLLLVFHWGYMNPQIDDMSGDPENPQKVFFNQKEMLALVGGTTLPNLDLQFEREAVMQGAEDDRYFVVVMAYDFAEALKKKKTLLWVARMSTPSSGLTMADVVPALVASGGPLFGRETTQPKWITVPVGREGRVEIGTPTVVPDTAEKKPAPEKK